MKKHRMAIFINKKDGRRKVLAFLLCVFILTELFPVSAWAQTGADVDGMQGNKEEVPPSNYVDIDYELPEDEQESAETDLAVQMLTADSIPESYRSDQVSENGLAVNYLPAMRNQSPLGICWTFSALGACEASMIRKGLADAQSIDLSERQLAYYFYNKGDTPDLTGGTVSDNNTAVMKNKNYLTQGGNTLLTIWHLVSWCGPVSENAAPYEGIAAADAPAEIDTVSGLMGEANSSVNAYGKDACHVQNAYMINLGNMTDQIARKQTVKELIMQYGALGISYYSNTSTAYDSVEYDSYYYYGSSGTNHAVQVVGWDDTFPKEHFVREAPGDGAWLIKNSWGEETKANAQSGYFWISYYDTNLNNGSSTRYAYVFDAEGADNYDNIYQYDGDAGISTRKAATIADIYKASAGEGAGEVLRSVGIGIGQSDVSCEITIYKDLKDASDPRSGEPVLTQYNTLDYPGYHTINLEKEISIAQDSRFSVVFSFPEEGNTGASVYISTDKKYTSGGSPFINVNTYENPGVSFYHDGTDWVDLSDAQNAVFRIKAYTDTAEWVPVPLTKIQLSAENLTMEKGKTDTVLVSYDPLGTTDDKTVSWNSTQTSVVSVTGGGENGSEGTLMAQGAGTATVTAMVGSLSANLIVTVTEPAGDNPAGGEADKPGDNPAGGEADKPGDNPAGGEADKPGDNPAGGEADKPGDNPAGGEADKPGDNPAGGEADRPGDNPAGGEADRPEDYIEVADLTGLIMSKQKVTITNGKTYSLSAYPIYSTTNVTPWMVYWKSSAPSVASVNTYGEVTAKKPGKTTITVYNGSIKATCTVTVKPKKAVLSSVKLTENRKAKLTWKKTEGASGYVVYRSIYANGGYKKAKTITGGSKLTITLQALKDFRAYYYKIRAYKIIDGKKVYGSWSEIKTVAPSQVTVTAAKALRDKQVKLTWKEEKNADGYALYRSTSSGGSYQKVTLLEAGNTYYTDTAPKAGRTYYYKLRAYRIINGKRVYGKYSQQQAVKTK